MADWMVADAVERNRSPNRRNREFFEKFRPKQASDHLIAASQSNFGRDPNQLHEY